MKLLRPMDSEDLEDVLKWRNHPSIRKSMLSQHKISQEEHIRWFELISSDPTKHSMIYEEEGSRLGYVNFNVIEKYSLADWGFYTSPNAPKGTGKSLGFHALSYGFNDLNLNKVCGQALSSNIASINFHLKLGFSQEGILRDQYKQDTAYQDIICFGLLQKDWLRNYA